MTDTTQPPIGFEMKPWGYSDRALLEIMPPLISEAFKHALLLMQENGLIVRGKTETIPSREAMVAAVYSGMFNLFCMEAAQTNAEAERMRDLMNAVLTHFMSSSKLVSESEFHKAIMTGVSPADTPPTKQ